MTESWPLPANAARALDQLRSACSGSVLVEYALISAFCGVVLIGVTANLTALLRDVIEVTASNLEVEQSSQAPEDGPGNAAPPAPPVYDFEGTPAASMFFELPLSIEGARNVYVRNQPVAFESTSLRLGVQQGRVGVICDWLPGCYGSYSFDAEIYAVNPSRDASASYSMKLSMEHPFHFLAAESDLGTLTARRGVLARIPVETRSIGGFTPEQPAEFSGTSLRLAREDDMVTLVCDWAGGCAGVYEFPVTLTSWSPELTISQRFSVAVEE